MEMSKIKPPSALGTLPLPFGVAKRVVYGGPYLGKPKGYFGVKMAAEIDEPCHVNVPTRDFSTPNVSDVEEGLRKVLWALGRGEMVWVGCMGGRGRTGLFMALLAKTLGVKNPVEYVREHYYSHAVETQEQYRFVTRFDVSGLQLTAKLAKGLGILTFWR